MNCLCRGKYHPPNAPPDGEKPLYLHISAGADVSALFAFGSVLFSVGAHYFESTAVGLCQGNMFIGLSNSQCEFMLEILLF